MSQKKQLVKTETKTKEPVIQRVIGWLKRALKSSIWGGVVGLCYCLLGLLTDPVSKWVQSVAGVCAIVNLISLIANILSACKKLDPPETEEREGEQADGASAGRGYQIAGGVVGAVGSATAGSADIVYISLLAKGTIDEELGIITESIAALKAVISLMGDIEDNSRAKGDKCIKGLKYAADLIASIIGIIAFSIAITNSSTAAWVFVGEVTIRGLRIIGSAIKTAMDLCAKKTHEISDSIFPVATQEKTIFWSEPVEEGHTREIISATDGETTIML